MSGPRLNRQLLLEAAERVADGAGGYVESWGAIGTLWAEIAPRTGRAANGEGGAVSVTGFRITVRAAPMGHAARPVAGQRFRMGLRVFRIEAVTEIEPRGLYLACACQEEVAA